MKTGANCLTNYTHIDNCTTHDFTRFLFNGLISLPTGNAKLYKIVYLRDTASNFSLISKALCPFIRTFKVSRYVTIKGLFKTQTSIPLTTLKISSQHINGIFDFGIIDDIPIQGVHLIIGNDCAKDDVMSIPIDSTVDTVLQNHSSDSESEIEDNFDFSSSHYFYGCIDSAVNLSSETDVSNDIVSPLHSSDSVVHSCHSNTQQKFSNSVIDESVSPEIETLPSNTFNINIKNFDNSLPTSVVSNNSLSCPPLDSGCSPLMTFEHTTKKTVGNVSSVINPSAKSYQWQSGVNVTKELSLSGPSSCSSDRTDSSVINPSVNSYQWQSGVNVTVESVPNAPSSCSSDGKSINPPNVSMLNFEESVSNSNSILKHDSLPCGLSDNHTSGTISSPLDCDTTTSVQSPTTPVTFYPVQVDVDNKNNKRDKFPPPSRNDNSIPFLDKISPQCLDKINYVNVMTRSMHHEENLKDECPNILKPFEKFNLNVDTKSFAQAQRDDKSLEYAFKTIVDRDKIDDFKTCFYLLNGILVRKYSPSNDKLDKIYYQVLVPTSFRETVMDIAHRNSHFGFKKTFWYLQKSFYWPSMRSTVYNFVKQCAECQLSKKGHMPKMHLQPIKLQGPPFSRIVVDCVGPLPKTKTGNIYIFTIICPITRFAEAFPLRNIRSKTILKCLLKFFCLFGLPVEIAHDQGSNFTSKVFKTSLKELGIKQVMSTAYHPETQGSLEKFHRSMKTLLRAFSLENNRDWDENLPFVMFSARSLIQDSLGLSPSELVFSYELRGPLELMKYNILSSNEEVNSLDYVLNFKNRLHKAFDFAKTNLNLAQNKMKKYYDKSSKERHFEVGDKVLAFLPVSHNPFSAKFCGPYEVLKRLGSLNYLVRTGDRRKKTQVFHINLLKKFFPKQDNSNSQKICNLSNVLSFSSSVATPLDPTFSNLYNYVDNIKTKLPHLDDTQLDEVKNILLEFCQIFTDDLAGSHLPEWTFQLSDFNPVHRSPYRLNPQKSAIMRGIIDELLSKGIISDSYSNYASSSFLVPKKDGSWRLVIDYRVLNSRCVVERHPLPLIEDLLDKISSSHFITTLDLQSGYHQVPLSQQCRHLTSFVTPFGQYQFNFMPFGLAGAPSAFQRRLAHIIRDFHNFAVVYIDDIAIFSESWEDHVRDLRQVFQRLAEYNLTVNVKKLFVGHATINYLGYSVGSGTIRPIQAKVDAIQRIQRPGNKKDVMRFLGMTGFYRRFMPHFSSIAAPLTNLLSKKSKFTWGGEEENSFQTLKSFLGSESLLYSPHYNEIFHVFTDASDFGIGGVLMHRCEDIFRPIAYFSKKFSPAELNYSTIEKECLALVRTMEHFDVYLSTGVQAVVYSDHCPLSFLQKAMNTSRRLARWFIALQRYNFVIEHISGSENVVADALSRLHPATSNTGVQY